MSINVGDGATFSSGSDRYPATVTAVRYFKSGARKGEVKEIDVQSDEYRIVKGGRRSEHQEYEFTRNAEAPVRTFAATTKFAPSGYPRFAAVEYDWDGKRVLNHYCRLAVGERNAYFDPSF